MRRDSISLMRDSQVAKGMGWDGLVLWAKESSCCCLSEEASGPSLLGLKGFRRLYECLGLARHIVNTQ